MGKSENMNTSKIEEISSSASNLSFTSVYSNTLVTSTDANSAIQYNSIKYATKDQGSIDNHLTNGLQNSSKNINNKAASGDTEDNSSTCKTVNCQNCDESFLINHDNKDGNNISVSTQSPITTSVSMNGKTSQLSYSTIKETVRCNNLSENKNNLIINYLPPNMSQEEVRTLFSSVGEVESCKLIREKISGESLGYAFVKFYNSFDAYKAIKTMNGLRLQNKIIKVSLARPSSESIKGANLYICGLPKNMNQNELEKLFSTYGHIITARILYDNKTELSRGVAFIRYDQRIEAETAIKRLNGYLPPGTNEPITVKFANSPGSNRVDNFNICFVKTSNGESTLKCPSNSGSYNTRGSNQTAKIISGTQMESDELYQVGNQMKGLVSSASVNESHPDSTSTGGFQNPIKHSETPSPQNLRNNKSCSSCKSNCEVRDNEEMQPNTASTSGHHATCCQTKMMPNKFPLHVNTANVVMNSAKTSEINSSRAGSLNKLNHVTRLKCQAAAAAVAAISGTNTASFPTSLPTFGMEFIRGIGSSAHALLAPAFAASSGALTPTGWCIFVYNLAPDTEESILWQLFGPFGAVQTVKVICDPANGKCKGFGFVTMSNYEEALLAIHSLNGFSLGNRVLQVSFKTTSSKQMKYLTNNIFNKNLLLSTLPGSVSNDNFISNS